MIKKQNAITILRDSFMFQFKEKFKTFPVKVIEGYNDIKYFESDLIVNMYGFRFGFTNNLIIVIEENLPNNIKKFILYHEVAHTILHKELLKDKKYMDKIKKDRIKNKVPNMEFEADLFSAKIIGKENAIIALKEMKKILPNNKEIDSRLEKLKNSNI